MRAIIIEGKKTFREMKDADLGFAHLDAGAFPGREVVQFQGGVDVRHKG
jgi:hypothetical protein